MPFSERTQSLTALERAVFSALAIDDDRKGALTVRAILAGMDNDQVLTHLWAQGRPTTLSSIRFYRSGINALERDPKTDGNLHWRRHALQADTHAHSASH